jgi:hypothetical protein
MNGLMNTLLNWMNNAMKNDDIGRIFIGLPPEFLLPRNKLKMPKKKRLVIKLDWTDSNMMEFAEWVNIHEWSYWEVIKIWRNKDWKEKTTAQLFEDFKDWKEEQK